VVHSRCEDVNEARAEEPALESISESIGHRENLYFDGGALVAVS
jgi:hypothetical protein